MAKYRSIDPSYYLTDTDLPVEVGEIFVHHRNGRGLVIDATPIASRPAFRRLKVAIPRPPPRWPQKPRDGRNGSRVPHKRGPRTP